MIFPAGHVFKFEPTAKGRERAAKMHAEHSEHCEPVLKYPHHVVITTDFELGPKIDPNAPKSKRVTVRFPHEVLPLPRQSR